MAESIIRWIAGLLAYISLAIVFFGIWRGARLPAGRTVGFASAWLRSAWFYLVTAGIFVGISYLGWRPLPLLIRQPARNLMLVTGVLLYFPGMLLLLWGRLVLGKNYFVSTGFGAQLFSGHQLITHGPYAIVRHPMYAGLILAALGSLLIYVNWTTLLYAIFAPFVIRRAQKEEIVLAAEFNERWHEYCRHVPMLIPGPKRLWAVIVRRKDR